MNKLLSIFILFLIPSILFAGSIDMHFVDMVTGLDVEDVTLDVYDYESNLLLLNVEGDSNGNLEINDLDGEYTLRVVKYGYSMYKWTQVVAESDDINLGDLFLVSLSTINVDVSNSSGPIDAVVTIQETDTKVTDVFEGANGELIVPAGSYTIFVYASNHVQKSFSVSVGPGEVKDVSYVLEYSNETLFPLVVNIDVEFDSYSVNAGDEVNFMATAIYNNGMELDVTSCVQWNIEDVGVLYGNEFVTRNMGNHTISAIYLGKTGSNVLTVLNGEIVSLSITASETSIERNEKITLSYNLEDIYSNIFSTEDVNCTASCGTLNNNEFSSSSVCTATISCVYNPNNEINSTISIQVTDSSDDGDDDDDSGSSSSGSSSGSSTGKTTTTTTTTTTTVIEEEEEVEEKLTSIKFILPTDLYEGDVVEIIVTDNKGEPVEDVEITVMDPKENKFNLLSDSNGLISFDSETFGNYFLYSEDYTIIGSRVVYIKSLMPDVSEINNTPVVFKPDPIIPEKKNETTSEDEERNLSVFNVLASTISGEMSIVDALKSTIHLWILIAITLISAAVFFVVYTYVIGNSVNKHGSSQNVKSENVEKVDVRRTEPVTPPIIEETSPPTEAQFDVDSNIEDKLERLRELKRKL